MRCISRLLIRFLRMFARGILVTLVALLRAGTALVGVPQRASSSSELLCRSFSQCSSRSPESADYEAAYLQSFWGMTSGHNCTNYVAYRLTHHGRLVARPPETNSASTWGQAAMDAGTRRIYLPRLSRGTHYLRVQFLPSDAASRASYSTAVKVVVR